MNALKTIVTRYQALRATGMPVKAALNDLRAEIEPLAEKEKQELARQLRALEASQEKTLHPLHSKSAPPVKEIVWVNCPHCGKSNQKHELLCYSCGGLLDRTNTASETQALAETNDLTLSDDFYGQDSMLELKVRGTGALFTVQPQKCEHEVVIGRSTQGSAMIPDVDLAKAEGEKYGVSRLHLTIRYQARYNTLSVFDLGSANGTYINGQRLHPQEVRVLRNGDELRLGRLVMNVIFLLT
ncbi:MAG: FHA domain-containing protein [Anaerolineae bacterium]|nr:FHA domain-containing protein [Anaerolineae bacterium]